MNRVLDQRILREQFFQSERRVAGQPPTDPLWQIARVRQYLELLRRFLTRLSMLIFLLGGQPARGTELFSLRYRNTFHGGYRNIYIEQGLLGFVTLYHKGYSIGGSLKIIHRYLPPVLSQVVVQYLVLVLPFSQQLSRLAYGQSEDSAFLWAQAETTWDPSRLSHFLRQESARELQVPLAISSWRHTAIAISREFIPKGTYFDREADSETSRTLDQQACYSNNTAGTIYGRLAQDGDGQIREFRERYRRVSLLWHALWLPEPPPSEPSEPLEPPVGQPAEEEPAQPSQEDPAQPSQEERGRDSVNIRLVGQSDSVPPGDSVNLSAEGPISPTSTADGPSYFLRAGGPERLETSPQPRGRKRPAPPDSLPQVREPAIQPADHPPPTALSASATPSLPIDLQQQQLLQQYLHQQSLLFQQHQQQQLQLLIQTIPQRKS